MKPASREISAERAAVTTGGAPSLSDERTAGDGVAGRSGSATKTSERNSINQFQSVYDVALDSIKDCVAVDLRVH